MGTSGNLTRRLFLERSAGVLGATLTLGSGIAAFAQEVPEEFYPPNANLYDFILPRVSSILPDWDFGPGGDENFVRRLGEEFGMRVRQSNGVRDMVPMNGKPDDFNACVNLSSLDSLNRYPVLFMSGTGKWVLPGDHAKNLKDYVLGGGFVFMDECAAPALEDDFYNSALSCLVNLFENEAVLPVPEDHVIYSNVYDIKSQGFKSFKRPNGVHPDMGVFLDGRLAVYLDNADLHCGWLDPKDTFIKRTLHEEGMQRGLNLFSYFLSYHKPAEI